MTSSDALLARAWQIARDSSHRAGIEIVELTTAQSQADARAVFDEVWPAEDGATQVRPNLLRALTHAGGYCVAAYDATGRQLLGATLAFLGRAADGTVILHSHMSAVIDAARNRHVGTAMKQHQRAWAWAQDIPVVSWTFDPLVRRNAFVNLVKLGIEVRGYHENFYGDMNDAINAGDPSDRMGAWWPVDSDRARRAADGELAAASETAMREAADVRLVATPEDIVSLRAADPKAARKWRLRVREQLQQSFVDGWVIDGITDEGSYVLRPAPGEGGSR